MKPKIQYILTILLLYLTFQANAQGEKNIWHFGDGAGLDFNSGSPISIPGFVYTEEGSSSIADASGNFLFSTDGINVYDRTGIRMPGCDTGLMGNTSSTSSAVIIPKPCSKTEYYLFCIDALGGRVNIVQPSFGGLSYSIVDITRRGGLGDVISLNNLLITPTAEKICAVKHKNERDIWVITHEWNTENFYAYLLTPFGINPPIITRIGSRYFNLSGSGRNEECVGYMVASPNGKKIACAISHIPNNNIELFDFNNTNGILSNAKYITSSGFAYGISFSPNSKLLYSKTYPYLSQWDITASDINSTKINLSELGAGAIILGPDDKIYIADPSSKYIHSIDFPNNVGVSCGFNDSSVFLTYGLCRFGLPTIINNKFIKNNPLTLDTILLCDDDSLVIILDSIYFDILWSNGNLGIRNVITNSGEFWVRVSDSCGTYYDTCYLILNSKNFIPDDTLYICIDSSPVVIDLGENIFNVLWSTGDTSRIIILDIPGVYWVRIQNYCGIYYDTFKLEMSTRLLPIIDLGNDTVKCWYDTISLYVSGVPTYSSILWQDGISTGINRPIIAPTTYIATYYDDIGCVDRDTIVVNNFPISSLSLPDDIYKCPDSLIQITASTIFVSYLWSNGSITPSITIVDSGWYILTVTDSFACTYTDSMYVENNFLNNPILGSNQVLCDGETIVLSPGTYENYLWSTGDIINTIEVNTDGYYSVFVSNGCEDTSLGVQITFIECDGKIAIPTAFSPNGDGVNDEFFPHFAFFYKLEEFSVFNRWGEKVYSSIDTPWDGSYNGREQGTSTYIYQVILHNTYKNQKVYKSGEVTLIK